MFWKRVLISGKPHKMALICDVCTKSRVATSKVVKISLDFELKKNWDIVGMINFSA